MTDTLRTNFKELAAQAEAMPIQSQGKGQAVSNLFARQITLDTEIDDDTDICTFNGVSVMSKGNFSCIAGQPKAGKTFFTSVVIAQYLAPDTEYLGVKCIPIQGKPKVLLIDTEQSKKHLKKSLETIQKIHSGDRQKVDNNLVAIQARGFDSVSIKEGLDGAFEIYKDFGLIVIDGIQDLMEDPLMNSDDAKAVISLVMKWTEDNDCHIIICTHTNRDGQNMTGHSGSWIAKKAESSIKVITEDVLDKDSIRTVAPIYVREMPFEPIHWRIDENRVPVESEAPEAKGKGKGKGNDAWIDPATDMLRDFLKDAAPMTIRDLAAHLTNGGCELPSNLTRVRDKLMANGVIKEAGKVGRSKTILYNAHPSLNA